MIDSPCGPQDDLAFNLFVMEEEGILPTRRGLLNRLKKYDIITPQICEQEGIVYSSITPIEWEYLNNKI